MVSSLTFVVVRIILISEMRVFAKLFWQFRHLINKIISPNMGYFSTILAYKMRLF